MRLRHVATVEPYLGAGAAGDQYGAPYELRCYYEGVRQLVRAADGSEAVSEGRMFTEVVDLPIGSKVTVLGRSSWVITVSTFQGFRSHLEVALA